MKILSYILLTICSVGCQGLEEKESHSVDVMLFSGVNELTQEEIVNKFGEPTSLVQEKGRTKLSYTGELQAHGFSAWIGLDKAFTDPPQEVRNTIFILENGVLREYGFEFSKSYHPVF